MEIDDLEVTLIMAGYTYNINTDKTNIYIYLKDNESFEELKIILDAYNFYCDYIEDERLVFIGKTNEFNWKPKDLWE